MTMTTTGVTDAAKAAGPLPFLAFAQDVQPQSALRAAVTAACRRPEPDCVEMLLDPATQPAGDAGGDGGVGAAFGGGIAAQGAAWGGGWADP